MLASCRISSPAASLPEPIARWPTREVRRLCGGRTRPSVKGVRRHLVPLHDLNNDSVIIVLLYSALFGACLRLARLDPLLVETRESVASLTMIVRSLQPSKYSVYRYPQLCVGMRSGQRLMLVRLARCGKGALGSSLFSTSDLGSF
jgi:hypothetical protein